MRSPRQLHPPLLPLQHNAVLATGGGAFDDGLMQVWKLGGKSHLKMSELGRILATEGKSRLKTSVVVSMIVFGVFGVFVPSVVMICPRPGRKSFGLHHVARQ